MRRFTFKLEKVLEVRAYYERMAELVLAEKSGRCTLLEMDLRANAECTRAAARDRYGRGRTLTDFMATELYVRRLLQERERTMKSLVAAELERENARVAYLEKSKDKEILEKLKDRKREEYYKAAGRAEVRILDDIAQNLRFADNPFAAASLAAEQ
ncbi:MAG: flagellar export protein FliJ [Spirochaetes bacterium]|nr:flagellar export protein FliJ [Spirochaetota bacterium]